jgi:hypothetical protein
MTGGCVAYSVAQGRPSLSATAVVRDYGLPDSWGIYFSLVYYRFISVAAPACSPKLTTNGVESADGPPSA